MSSPPGTGALESGGNLDTIAAAHSASVLYSSGSESVNGAYTEVASLTAGSLNADLLPSTDVSGYKWISVHIGSTAFSGTLTFQCSNDNTSWSNYNLVQSASSTTFGSTVTSTNLVYYGPLSTRYFRIRMTSYSSGSASGTVELYTIGSAMFSNSTQISNFPGNTDNNTLIASAALTTNTNSSDQTNSNNRGCYVYINTGTFGSGATAITVTIQGKDPVSGTYYTILQSASLSASTFTILQVGPGVPAVANLAAQQSLPKTWRVQAAASAWGTGGSTIGVSMGLNL